MKRLAAITLMAAVAGGCAMLDEGPARSRRGGDASSVRQTPKTSPFEALAARMSTRKCKPAADSKQVAVASEDGPALPDVKPGDEKSQAVVSASSSAGTPMPTYLPEHEPVAKTAGASKPGPSNKKAAAEAKPAGAAAATATAASGKPSQLPPIVLTSNQTIEPAEPKGSTASGPSLSTSSPAHEPKQMSSAAGMPNKMPTGIADHADAKATTPAMYKTAAAALAEQPETKPAAPAVRMVNSKRISLNYEVKDVGPSGVSTVELWYTQDGRKWEKCDASPQPNPPFVVDVKEEGLYGFTLVARSGIGLGKRPPRPGDLPQVWVEVDLTKPVVKLLDLQVGVSAEAQHLTIIWKATDKNLGQRPITLSYAEQTEGPWTPIAAGVENTGSYVWRLPAGIPHRFYVRIEATDLVGNTAFAQTGEPILIDLAQPTAAIIAVEPGK